MARGGADYAPGLLPNVRKLFPPDPGYIILDCDLAGADAQVVAWEAGDEDLKEAFKQGLNVHDKNATDMWGDRFALLDPKSHIRKQMRQKCKHSVHGTNYGATARTIAITQGWTIYEAEQFQENWFSLHPGIRDWHYAVMDSLERTRSVSNKFGFRIYYFDRIDSVFTEALAWVPQSTVALTCFKGALQVEERLPWVEMLLQVHDSLVMQIPKKRIRDVLLIRDALINAIPYDDPLIIPWGLALSDVSWGDVKEKEWEEAAEMVF